ncbi:MAG: hypothetical protein WC584_03450 [Candidatus Pacearchaeota archaeon]
MNSEIYEQIVKKKEFSRLSQKDVEIAFNHFEKRQTSTEEKVRLTRELLHKVFGAFSSEKLLNKKILDKKSNEEILKKHISTRERFEFYRELYDRIFKDVDGNQISIVDLGAGVNGLSYDFFPYKIKYIGGESIGQFVDLTNYYFTYNKLNGKAIHLSLFELEKVKEIIKKTKGKKIIFLFKVVDSLEMLERNYSKKLLKEIINLNGVEKIVVSFATRSLISKKNFKVKRYWFENFVREEFNLLENFELGGERYFVFKKK